MSNDYLAPLAAKLTWNGAYNLRHTVTDPCPLNPDNVCGKGRIFTGLGKWTTLAAIGVENNIIRVGAAERRGEFDHAYITPLGRELAAYIHAHWDELTFRDPPKRY